MATRKKLKTDVSEKDQTATPGSSERGAFVAVSGAVLAAIASTVVTIGITWFGSWASGPTYSPKLMGAFVGTDDSNQKWVLYVPENSTEHLLLIMGDEAFQAKAADVVSVKDGTLTVRLSCAATGDPNGGMVTFGEGNSLLARYHDRIGNVREAMLAHSR